MKEKDDSLNLENICMWYSIHRLKKISLMTTAVKMGDHVIFNQPRWL
jgi:hypothetical protein